MDNEISEDTLIKKTLSRFTDDFSSEDIQFVKDIDFPKTIKITDLDKGVDDPDRVFVRDVEDLDGLRQLFKKLPINCEINIPDISGNMVLVSRL